MAASCGAFLRRLLWFCALCTVRARAGSMPKSVGSMPKSVKAVMKAAQARVNEAHDQIKHHTELWNCKEDLEHFSSKWSPEKQKYCCALGMGCLGQSGSELTPTSAAAAGGGDAVADGLETHGGTGSSDGAAESRGTTVSPDSTTEDNSRTLTVEVGKPFAEKVEHESMMGTTYEAMAGSGGVWPSWLQFDPAQGRLYGIPAAVSEPMSVPIEVAKTTFSGGQFNHDTFRYKLVVVPAGAESTTLRTTTVVSTTDALTGAAATMLGISSPAATPGAKGGTAQGTSAAPGASGSTGAGPSAGSSATPSPASAIKASSAAASEAAAAERDTPASPSSPAGTGSSDGAAESRGTTVSPDSTTEDNSRTLTVEVGKPFAEKVEHESMMGATYEAMAGSGGVWPSWLQFDPAQGRLYGIPAAVSGPMSVPIEVAKTTFSGGQFNHDTFRYKLVVVPAGAESTTLRTTTVVSTTDALTGAAATMLGISSPAATPGAKGGTAQGTSAATGASGSTGAGPSAGSAATPSPASAGTIKASSTAASEAAAAKRVTTSMAAASLGAQAAAAQSTTGPPAAPTTSMVKLVPSDKEKAIAEELIQHEVPAKLATLGSVGHLPSPGYGGCIIQDAMCEPLDMNWSLEELGRKAEDAEDCQQQCRDKVNCACFTYYAHLKACHFGSAMSDVRKNTPGFVGGKAYCDDALQGLAPHTVTQIIRKRKCMSDVSFFPAMCTVRAPTTFLDDPVDCEHRCQDHDWCSSFAYSTLTKSCDLQCANATPIHAPVYTMSGPKICTLSLVLGMTLTCPWNFDYEAEKWAQVLVSGLVHVVAKIRTLGGSKANSLTAHDVGVSMDKPDNSADNSRSYQLHIDVNEHLAMYLYFLLKSKTTGSKFDEYTQNFTSNAAETVLKSQCHPKVSLDFVKKQVEGASFQKLAPLGQSLDLMNHSVQQYSARKAETTDGTKFGWLLMTVGSFMAVLALWMLPRWRVQFSKGQCIPSCEPRPEVDVRQAQVGVPLIDEDRLPSEDELRPQLMQIPQETDSLMV